MSCQNKAVVSVKDLTLGIVNEDDPGRGYKFTVNYGTFDIFPGDFVIVKGRNGCGKSTFLRLFRLQGVKHFKVKNGEILFCCEGFPQKSIHNYSDDELSDLACSVSFIKQDDEFASYDSAYSYIVRVCDTALKYKLEVKYRGKKDALLLYHREYTEKRKELDELIRKYYGKYLAESLGENYKIFLRKKAREWSGGQQKMISVLADILKAKICGLELMVMDEPLNNLDGKNKYILNGLIKELREDNPDIAIIAITHCQIFDGINKVLTISEGEDGVRIARFEPKTEYAHTECLENYK